MSLLASGTESLESVSVWEGAHTRSPEETRAAGAQLVRLLQTGAVVALHGELGSGKTTFVQGMAQGLALDDEITSPTFALIHEYGQPPRLYHIDCYREGSLDQWRQIGLHEYFEDEAITVIEWAERLSPLLPERTLHLTFTHGQVPEERVITVGT